MQPACVRYQSQNSILRHGCDTQSECREQRSLLAERIVQTMENTAHQPETTLFSGFIVGCQTQYKARPLYN